MPVIKKITNYCCKVLRHKTQKYTMWTESRIFKYQTWQHIKLVIGFKVLYTKYSILM